MHSGTYSELLTNKGFDHRRLPIGQGAYRGPRAAPSRRPEASTHRRRGARAQSAWHRRIVSARRADLGDRCLRFGKIDFGQRHPGGRVGQPAQRRPAGPGPAHPGHRAGPLGQIGAGRPVTDRPARPDPIRPPTPGCSTRFVPCSRPPPRLKSVATNRVGSRSTSRAVAARRAQGTAPSRSR